MVKYTMQPTTAQTHKWTRAGIASRVLDAIELDTPAGRYYIAAADVPDALDLGIVPLYQFVRAADGARYPEIAGHVRTSQSERMIVVQIDGREVVQVPRFALIAHYQEHRSTEILTPPDWVMPARGTTPAASSAWTAGAVGAIAA